MKLQLTIIALLLSLTATAQNIVLTSDRQEDKSVIIRVDKQGYGRYTLAIKFKDLDNCDFVPNDSYLIRSSTDLIRLRPLYPKAHVGYSYSYRWWNGDLHTRNSKTAGRVDMN